MERKVEEYGSRIAKMKNRNLSVLLSHLSSLYALSITKDISEITDMISPNAMADS
ncbi:MAG: hypothetical protein OEQ39_12885 [Gammaproteobacteria bacterium]|nr:hypothetical protein [Gammaproteobacteria bacterium]MDH3464344.1 hypothetical protein [Gammaproteobacteria bacterium]